MSIEWKPQWSLPRTKGAKKEEEWEQGIICAESNGAKLQVFSTETDEDGLHVSWKVTRPRKVLNVFGSISCDNKEELKSAFAKAKKLAEAFALCWPTDSN